MLLHSKRRKLDLPGFKNLEGLPIGLFLAQGSARRCLCITMSAKRGNDEFMFR